MDNVSLITPEKLNPCYNFKEDEILPQSYGFASLLSGGVSFTGNWFFKVIREFLGNYPLPGEISSTV